MKIIYPNKVPKLIVIGISISILITSLFFPAFYVDDPHNHGWPAILAFLTGWLGIYGAGISWIANPCLIFAWLTMVKRPQHAAIAGLAALLFAFIFLSFKEILIDEAGNMGNIKGLAVGYYLWVTSILVCFAGSAIFYLLEKNGIRR